MSSLPNYVLAGYLQYYSTHYAQISSMTFLTWDYAITFSDEVELFWSGRWNNPMRILFFINRYQAFAWQILHTIGVFRDKRQVWIHHLIGVSAIFLIVPINSILSLRIYGLYGRPRWLAILLGTMLLAAAAIQMYIIARFEFVLVPMPFLEYASCFPALTHLYLAMIPAVGFDIPALVLVLLRGISHMRRQEGVGFRPSSLVRVMTRDSVWYFIMLSTYLGDRRILLIYAASAVAWVKLPAVDGFITFGYGFSMISVAGSRMLLNLKRETVP
ncbi:hypothetical protein ONZ45_g11282 [Pleurotus djamor]|nr:hypothetical protein ONZ45_g11282 [Pleurotus djamor]